MVSRHGFWIIPTKLELSHGEAEGVYPDARRGIQKIHGVICRQNEYIYTQHTMGGILFIQQT